MTDSAPSSPPPGWRTTPAGPPWGLAILDRLFRVVPLPVAYVLTWPFIVGWFFHWNHPRFAVIRAMARAGQRWPTLAALQVYHSYAASLVERHYTTTGRLSPQFQYLPDEEIRPTLRAAVDDPSPLVILGSHHGVLELAASVIQSRGRVVRAVAIHDAGAGGLLAGVGDPARGVGSGPAAIVADGSMESGLRMLRALRAGEALCLKGDRPLPAARPDQVLTVPFLGEAAIFPRGPFELARAAKARVVVLAVVRRGLGRYGVMVDRLDIARPIEEVIADYGEILGRHVRVAPHDWFNFFPYWPADLESIRSIPATVPPALRALGPALGVGVVLGLVLSFGTAHPWRLTLLAPLSALTTLLGGVLDLRGLLLHRELKTQIVSLFHLAAIPLLVPADAAVVVPAFSLASLVLLFGPVLEAARAPPPKAGC